MKKAQLSSLLPAALSVILSGVQPAVSAEQTNASHLHLGHVLTEWSDTPNQRGFAPTALAEAKVALQHARAAAQKPEDLTWMQLHTQHVMHALDPASAAQGPGLGYGLIKAAQGVSKHIQVAAQMSDASEATKLHSVHVATSARNATRWAQEALALCGDVMRADAAAMAAVNVEQLVTLVARVQSGVDANGDGQITWHEAEGGLNESLKHARILAQLEGVL